MKLPSLFSRKTEDRNAAVYTDAIVAQIIAQARDGADGTEPSPLTTGPMEIAAGVISRAFASARVEGADLSPSQLASLVRSMVVRGEALAVYNGIELIEVGVWTIEGNPSPSTWRYKVQLDSPSGRGMDTVTPHSTTVHARYSYDPSSPWIGVGPLQRSLMNGQLAANVERSLRDEASGRVGYLLPIPTDGADATVAQLKSDLKTMKGKTYVVETTAAGWGEGRASAPRQDYVPQRIGMNPPISVPQIHAAVQASVLAVCGVPVELVQIADGTGQREAWRRCLHGTIEPLSRILIHELSRVYARPVSISFDSLFASDIQGRARAFQSLAHGGMDLMEAAAASGILNAED